MIFLAFSKVFDVQGLPAAILAQHGLQDDFKSPWNAFHGFQHASKNLSDGPKSPQDTPKSLQDAPKTRPREVQKSKFSPCCSIVRFPRPSWRIFAQHGRQNASKMPTRASKMCLRPPRPLPKSASKSLLLRPRPFTKGGLAVVRPRRPSSIMTKLVGEGSPGAMKNPLGSQGIPSGAGEGSWGLGAADPI